MKKEIKKQEKAPYKEIKYKMKIEVEIEGTLNSEPLIEESGTYCYIQWAIDDIEEKLDCVCTHTRTKSIHIEEAD